MSSWQKLFLISLVGLNLFVVFYKKQPEDVIQPINPIVLDVPVAPREEELKIQWIELTEHKKVISENSIYGDIINHSREPFKSYGNRSTTAHETTHGINAYVRNTYARGLHSNGFYVCNGKAVVIDEPKFRKSSIIPFIPQSLRYNRYKLYIEGQKEWDDTPLYIYDEWVAYVNGTMCIIDDCKNGKNSKERTDDAMSCVEFFVYATAVAMSCEQHDPDFFKNNRQWRDFTKWHLQRSLDVYRECSKIEQYNWDNGKYYKEVKDTKAISDFLQNKMGMDLKKLFPE